MIKIKYVQFEPAAAITDAEVVSMTTEQYRAYWELIWYLYCNGGKCEADPEILAPICRCENVLHFTQRVWPKVKKKFQLKNGFVRHKRVTKELQRAKKFIQHQRRAGLASAAKRQPPPNLGSTVVQPRSLVQPSEVNETKAKTNRRKENEEKKRRSSASDSRNSPLSPSTSLRFQVQLEKIIRPCSTSDKKALHNLNCWLVNEIHKEMFSEEIYSRVLDYANEATTKGRNPIAFFFSTLRREIGYTKKAV